MSYISEFIKQYEMIQNSLSPHFESDLRGLIKEVTYKLTQERFYPSAELKLYLKNLAKKAREPLKLGIFGARDSGKSIFINTILKNHILPSEQAHAKKTYIISYGHTKSIIAYRKEKIITGLNTLSLNSLTQEELDKITHFEIKFPISMLKEFNIYKYPDIDLNDEENIQKTIEKINQCDVLLWLNRIDELANTEELNILKPHIAKKSTIALCILTHIDILEKSEDIIPTLSFFKEHFGDIFADVLPISAMILYRELKIDEEFFLQKELQKLYYNYSAIKSQDFDIHQKFLTKAFADGSQNISSFYENISPIPKELQNQEINFNAIFERLHLSLIPTAKKQKDINIKEDLLLVVEKIKKSYTNLINIYSKFLTLLQTQTQLLWESLLSLETRAFEELDLFFKNLDSDCNNIIESILQNTHPQKLKISLQNPTLMQTLKGKKAPYNTYTIDSETIYQELLNPKSRPYRTYKAFNYRFSKLSSNINSTLEKSLDSFSAELKKWQAQNELIKKKENILSDFSYNNLRISASKIYENIALDFIERIMEADKEIQILLCKASTQLQSRRELSIKYTISLLLQRFYKDLKEASIHYVPKASSPTKEELYSIIDENFSLQYYHQIENSLSQIFKTLQEDITQLGKDKSILVQTKINDLCLLEKTINEIYQYINSPR